MKAKNIRVEPNYDTYQKHTSLQCFIDASAENYCNLFRRINALEAKLSRLMTYLKVQEIEIPAKLDIISTKGL